MKQVNLLPKIEQRELKLQFYAERMLAFWIWVACSIAVFFVLSLLTVFYLNRMMNETQTQITQNKALLDSSDFKDLQNQIILLNRNIKEINNLQTHHYFWSNALIELSSLVPPEMQLNQIGFSQATGKIQIIGQAKTREKVIEFWANVIKSEYFKNINFPLTNLEKATNPDFTYTFSVNPDKFKTE